MVEGNLSIFLLLHKNCWKKPWASCHNLQILIAWDHTQGSKSTSICRVIMGQPLKKPKHTTRPGVTNSSLLRILFFFGAIYLKSETAHGKKKLRNGQVLIRKKREIPTVPFLADLRSRLRNQNHQGDIFSDTIIMTKIIHPGRLTWNV